MPSVSNLPAATRRSRWPGRVRWVQRLALAFAAAALAGAPLALAQTSRPNIVVVIADDLGYADLGCYGAPAIATPAIDALAVQGARLTSFYTHPSCTPTRAALMTGKYAERLGIDGPIGIWADVGLASHEVTMAEELRMRGYRTGFFGKWHLGDSPEQLPLNQGFDDWFGSPWGLLGRPDILMDSAGPDRWSGDLTTWTRQFTDRTLSFIEDAAQYGQPFFAVLSHHVPHYPATPGMDFIGTSADGREYGDAVEELDSGVNEIVTLLAALGVGDDTLVVFLSDNGPTPVFGPYQAGSTGPFTGWKGSTLEGGVRVPCVIRWPAGIPAGLDVDSPVHVVDLLPTLLSILDGTAPPAGEHDGRDVRTLLSGGTLPPAEDVVYYPGFGTAVDGVRRGRYKLRAGKLHDLVVDPAEQVDLAATAPQLVADLEVLRAALELDLTLNATPAEPTSRRRPSWRADSGLASVAAGSTWEEGGQGWSPWLVVDDDPVVDLVLVSTSPGHPVIAPHQAVRAAALSSDVRLVRTGDEFAGRSGGPFSVSLWLRFGPTIAPGPTVVLDIGDDERGFSITRGDAGVLGDDPSPGLADDLRIRAGGAASPGSTTLDLDLPQGDDLHLLVVTVSADGVLRAYLDAVHVGAAAAGAQIHWGGESVWALLGFEGPLGGDGGAGPRPLPASAGFGDVAGLRVWDRELSSYEAEAEYARYNAYRYCGGQMSSIGERVVLELFGSFLPSDHELRARVDGLPPGAIGILVAGPQQGRSTLGTGYYCISGPIQRLSIAAAPSGGGTLELPVLGPNTSGSTWDPPAGSRWSMQFIYRDGASFRPSSAVSVLLGF